MVAGHTNLKSTFKLAIAKGVQITALFYGALMKEQTDHTGPAKRQNCKRARQIDLQSVTDASVPLV